MRKRVAKALQSWEEADQVLQEIGHLDRQIGRASCRERVLYTV